MKLFRDLLGRPAPDGVQKTLRVLDCSDVMDLASMYGEARDTGDIDLMKTINYRMGQVLKDSGLICSDNKE